MVDVLNSIFRILFVLMIFTLKWQEDISYCSKQVSGFRIHSPDRGERDSFNIQHQSNRSHPSEHTHLRKYRQAGAGPAQNAAGNAGANVAQTAPAPATGVCASNACDKRECLPTIDGGDYRCACSIRNRGKYCDKNIDSCVFLKCKETTHCFTSSWEGGALCICNDGVTSVFCVRGDDKNAMKGTPSQLDAIKFTVSKKTREIIEDFTHLYLYAAAGTFLMIFLCMACHCRCVSKKRKEIKNEYRHMLEQGKVPSDLPPDLLGISFIVLKETLCCKKKKNTDAKGSKSKSRDLDDKEAAFNSIMSVRTDGKMMKNRTSRLKRRPSSNRNRHASGGLIDTYYTTKSHGYCDNAPRRYSKYASAEDRDSPMIDSYTEIEENDFSDPYHENIPLLCQEPAHENKSKLMNKSRQLNRHNEYDSNKSERNYIVKKRQKNNKDRRKIEESLYQKQKARPSNHDRIEYDLDQKETGSSTNQCPEQNQTRRNNGVPSRRSRQTRNSSYDMMNDYIDGIKVNETDGTRINQHKGQTSYDPTRVNNHYCHIQNVDNGRERRKSHDNKHESRQEKHHVANGRHSSHSTAFESLRNKGSRHRKDKMHGTLEMAPMPVSENTRNHDTASVVSIDNENVAETVSRPRYVAYSYSETPHLIHIADSGEPGHKYHNKSQHCSVQKPPSPGKYRQMMLSKGRESVNNSNLHNILNKASRKQKSKLFDRTLRNLLVPELGRRGKDNSMSSICESVSSESLFSSTSLHRAADKSRFNHRLKSRQKRIHLQGDKQRNKNVNANYQKSTILGHVCLREQTEIREDLLGSLTHKDDDTYLRDEFLEISARHNRDLITENTTMYASDKNANNFGLHDEETESRQCPKEKRTFESMADQCRYWIKEADSIVSDLLQRFPSRTEATQAEVSDNNSEHLEEVGSRALLYPIQSDIDLMESESEGDSTVVPTDISTTDESDITIIGEVKD